MSRPRRVLVTGASRGIGRAVAERLLDEGREVVLVARDAEALEEVAARAPERAAQLTADLVADPGALVATARTDPGLDGFVHAAGIAPHAPLGAVDDAAMERAYRLHVLCPLKTAQALSASLRARGAAGALVFVTSTLARRPAPTTLAYSASKAALESMTRSLALELADASIRVNAVSPGVVDTDMVRALRGGPPPADEAEARARVEAQLQALRALHPLGRLGEPREIADAVRYLLDAPWTTGAVLTVDGGLTAG